MLVSCGSSFLNNLSLYRFYTDLAVWPWNAEHDMDVLVVNVYICTVPLYIHLRF
jgi:hypothetical protein